MVLILEDKDKATKEQEEKKLKESEEKDDKKFEEGVISDETIEAEFKKLNIEDDDDGRT